MKHAQFDYVNQFHCLAGDCPDTCCKDWQIILDEDALARYRAMPGSLGEQVCAALVTENGETRFREEGGRCVLLRDDGLCPIQAAYGAEALCRTCYTHPRFTEEYGQTAELTLSLSCPEAARLLLTHEAPLRIETQDDGGPVVPNELDPELARRFCGRGYQDRSLVRLARLRSRAGRFFPCWMVLNNMEHLTKRFESMLDAAMHQDAPPAAFRAELAVPYENLLVYFLFRYALKAVNDRQLLPRVAACVFHLLCLRELLDDAGSETALCAAASLYSKEVEHSEENQQLLLKLFRRKTLTWQYLVSVLDA